MAEFAQQPNGLHPAEAFFDAFAPVLTDRVPGERVVRRSMALCRTFRSYSTAGTPDFSWSRRSADGRVLSSQSRVPAFPRAWMITAVEIGGEAALVVRAAANQLQVIVGETAVSLTALSWTPGKDVTTMAALALVRAGGRGAGTETCKWSCPGLSTEHDRAGLLAAGSDCSRASHCSDVFRAFANPLQ